MNNETPFQTAWFVLRFCLLMFPAIALIAISWVTYYVNLGCEKALEYIDKVL